MGRRGVISLLLAACLISGPEIQARGFNDINVSSNNQQAIEKLSLKGVAVGTGHNAFKPERELILAELMTFLGRIAGESASINASATGNQSKGWFAGSMSWGIEAGLLDGKETGHEKLTAARTNDILKRFSEDLGVQSVQAAAKKTLITRGEVSVALSKLSDLRDEATRRELTDGKIQGYLSANDKSIAIYKGIPYAAAPVGELRWKAPQPVKPWNGVRDTIAWSASAIQPAQAPFWSWSEEFIIEDTGYSEDSLYLNVWAKNDQVRNKPVIVYIHGGGFTSGGSSVEVYDGEYMASQDAVYVSINYRVGILGFLATEELSAESDTGSSGNYGLMDQIKALKWVQENIAQFGGDPSNVTIMGQSAGSFSVNALVASPLYKGLFSKAVGMSFNIVNWDLSTSEEMAKVNAKALGDLTLKELRAMPAEELLKLETRSLPVIDGYVLKENYDEAIKNGRSNKVELMSGMVPGDAFLLSPISPMIATVEDYQKAVKTAFGDFADRFLALYPAEERKLPQVIEEINKDQMMALQNLLAQIRAASGDKATYLYYFTHVMPGPESAVYGAFHTSDVPYFLNKFSDLRAAYWTKTDYAIGNVASQYLLNFARTGNPNGKGLPTWSPATGANDYLEISEKSSLQKINEEKAALWTAYLNQKHYSQIH
ncbi:carboxylesterase family protein [Paenibacillus sp. LHD-117]|uniref:carboxylesterase/lipase family protein n=1 Tax=Paenibacillus sp. LHD-117 TaxID=3071412 RepID=UPI0027E15A50|nr:carboxylesterase family protein [Paenibacillus sp. LHD-117]MDQ6421443.1 carboxylesterase family protein [Paenibacillus sp. LHD-117]